MGGLVYPVLPAVLGIFLCVAAISPYLNRSVGKIGVNRLLLLYGNYQLSFVEVRSLRTKMSKYYEVSKVLQLGVRSIEGRKEYRVRLRGFGSAADSWVKEEDCNGAN